MFSRLYSCRRGVVSVEAAFVLPILISLVVGAMEFALLLYTYNTMQNTTRDVARRLAMNSLSLAEVSGELTGHLPRWAADSAEVAVGQSTPGIPVSNVITVTVSVPAAEATPISFFTSMSDDWDLQTQVVMKQELPL